MLRTLLADERGFAMTEWSIVVGTMALGAIVTFVILSHRLNGVLATVLERLSSGGSGR